jgi:hypothetical protein
MKVIKDLIDKHYVAIYAIAMSMTFIFGNVFVDSHNSTVLRFLYPDSDILMIFLFSVLTLLFLYTYFRNAIIPAQASKNSKILILIFTCLGTVGILTQNMLLPFNHTISYLELALVMFLFLALFLGNICDEYSVKFRLNYLSFIIGIVIVNTIFIIIKKIVYEQIGYKGINLNMEIPLLGSNFNITALLLLIFIFIIAIMVWNVINSYRYILKDLKSGKPIDMNNRNFFGAILNQGVILISLLCLIFGSFYLLKNQDILKEMLHFPFAATINYYKSMTYAYISNILFFVSMIIIVFFIDLSSPNIKTASLEKPSKDSYVINLHLNISEEKLKSIKEQSFEL